MADSAFRQLPPLNLPDSSSAHTPDNHSTSNSPPNESPSAAASSQIKRKRKDKESKAKPPADQAEEDEAERGKRTKTQRACDPCRRKKIRCDIVPDSEPTICQHCKQYNGDCTFYLPIQETRFKKQRMQEAAAAGSSSGGQTIDFKPPLPSANIKHDPSLSLPPLNRASSSSASEPKEVKIYGPTSLSFILHSTPSVPVRAFENYDQRYHQTWEVGRTGDGFIQVSDNSPPGSSAALPRIVDPNRLDREVLASLINSYFREVAPQFPILSEAEFLSTPSPPPVLLYAICCVAASRRGVQREVFEGLRAAVNQIIKAEDVLSNASVVNVQAMLILGMSGDAHATSIAGSMTAAWLRTGAAIRMAQDLGLYRAEAVKKNVELRRRLWGACVIADRWYGACFGHPFMVDVLDCDVRLPTPDDPVDPALALTKPNCYLAELIKLSILLGKVTKTIYSPSGLVHATDAVISQLLLELDLWRENLHPDLKFKGPTSILPAGLLHLFYSCVCMMFWRVFMRLSYRCPAHLKFSLTVERWTDLVKWSRESIEWLDQHDRVFDSWMFVSYAASGCAFIQYHTWARRRDSDAVRTLKILRDCVRRWEEALPPGHLAARRSTAEIIILLYEVTQLPRESLHRAGDPLRLNPTVGVSDRPAGTENFIKLKFTKDSSRPGGGVFVADDQHVAESVSDLPLGTVVYVQGEKDGATHTDAGDEDDRVSLLLNIAPSGSGGGFGGFPPQPPSTPANVNPSMNINYAPVHPAGVNGWQQPMGGGVQVLNLLDQPPMEQNALGAYQMLQGIPFDTFSSVGWEEYFARIAPSTTSAGQFLSNGRPHQQQQQSHP